MNESERNELDLSHRKILWENRVNFVEIRGSYGVRSEEAKRRVEESLESTHWM